MGCLPHMPRSGRKPLHLNSGQTGTVRTSHGLGSGTVARPILPQEHDRTASDPLSVSRLWCGFGVAWGWLWWRLVVAWGWLGGGFRVALGWLWTPESMPSICLLYGFGVALGAHGGGCGGALWWLGGGLGVALGWL